MATENLKRAFAAKELRLLARWIAAQRDKIGPFNDSFHGVSAYREVIVEARRRAKKLEGK